MQRDQFGGLAATREKEMRASRRAPRFRQTRESYFRVPLRKEHRSQSVVEQTANRSSTSAHSSVLQPPQLEQWVVLSFIMLLDNQL